MKDADYNIRREKTYQQDAEDIVYRAKIQLHQEGSAIYVRDIGGKHLLCTVSQPKRMWYETWLALTERYPEHDHLRIR